MARPSLTGSWRFSRTRYPVGSGSTERGYARTANARRPPVHLGRAKPAPVTQKEHCVVTVGDAEDSVYQGLQSLPWRVYLVAMWILCGELQTLYAPWIHEADRPLMASTMDLIRDVVIVGESDGTARRGREVARARRTDPGPRHACVTTAQRPERSSVPARVPRSAPWRPRAARCGDNGHPRRGWHRGRQRSASRGRAAVAAARSCTAERGSRTSR